MPSVIMDGRAPALRRSLSDHTRLGQTTGELDDALATTCSLPSSGGGMRRLGRYGAKDRERREVLALPLEDGSTLVLDCGEGSLSDARVVARIAHDEPPENSTVICELYLADETRGCCRPLAPEDLDPITHAALAASDLAIARILDSDGCRYRLRALAVDGSFPQLRWTASAGQGPEGAPEALTLRDVIARLESYDPPRAITVATLARFEEDDSPSTTVLRCELTRVLNSPVILNRGLREAVDRALATGATMSQIAIRCGRMKRDRRGKTSGETSWLARRIGRLPEGGQAEPTPWIHSATLALIAREGLGLNPNEVEV